MNYENFPGYKHCFMCGRVRNEGLYLGITCKNPYASGVYPDGKRYFCDICQSLHTYRTMFIVADGVGETPK